MFKTTSLLVAGCVMMTQFQPALATSTRLTRDQVKICDHLLEYYPTPVPLEIVVASRIIFVCQPDHLGSHIKMTIKHNDLIWWRDHELKRPIILDEDDDCDCEDVCEDRS